MDNESGIWVPAELLVKADRERDEARAHAALADKQRNAAMADFSAALIAANRRHAEATALLREARTFLRDDYDENWKNRQDREMMNKIDAFLAGQPAPAKVDDAMVERALSAYLRYAVDARAGMRAALAVALEGRT